MYQNEGMDCGIIRVATSTPKTPLISIWHHLPPNRYSVVSRETILRWLAYTSIKNQRPLRHLPKIRHHIRCWLDFLLPQASWSMTNEDSWSLAMNSNSVSMLKIAAQACRSNQVCGLIQHLLSSGIQRLYKMLQCEKGFFGTHDHL